MPRPAHPLQSDLNWLKTASERLNPLLEQQIPDAPPIQVERPTTIPHLLGYQKARDFRRSLDIAIDPIPNLAELLHQKCSWPDDPKIIIGKPQNPGLTALVGKDSRGDPRIVEEQGALSRCSTAWPALSISFQRIKQASLPG